MRDAKVVDLFCGIGGLTNGFIQEEFQVAAGYDIDESCRFAYEANNAAAFVCKDISDVAAEELNTWFGNKTKILVGCAPCQPFSSYAYKSQPSKKWFLLNEFARLIADCQPEIVSMENVSQLLHTEKVNVFKSFVDNLRNLGYQVWYEVVNCKNYGLPQNRRRLVLLASKLGEIKLIPPTHTEHPITVKDVIANLPPIKHGESNANDPLHKAAQLSPINLKRIQQSKQGGTWRDWDEDLQLDCHKKTSGQTYGSVYGRMRWDAPAPTITTQCYGIGNGRFGHPEQDRAISLREAAILQGFPVNYRFFDEAKKTYPPTRTISTHIGNAVPPVLGAVIAKSIKIHLQNYG